jgi:hypothetical protein
VRLAGIIQDESIQQSISINKSMCEAMLDICSEVSTNLIGSVSVQSLETENLGEDVKMAKRTIVFPNPKQLVMYAKKAGITVGKLWEIIEAELTRQPRTRQIVIHGPKQAVKIKVRRDSRKLEKQTFAGAELGVHGPHGSETDEDIERQEDAGKAYGPSIEDIVDEKNISDMNPAVKKGRNRTPWPIAKTEVEAPRYPISKERSNRFDQHLSEDYRERRRLFREQWAEANRNHDWPSWLVCDYDNRFCGGYPSVGISEPVYV